MRVLIVAHFCDYGKENTNNRFNFIAELLSRNGIDVELVTSSFSHRDKLQRDIDDTPLPYKMRLIYEPSYRRNISLKRLLISHPTMARNFRKYLKSCKKPDLIYCAIPSVDLAEQAAKYAKKQGIPFVIDVQDLWPEAYRLIIKNKALYRIVTLPMKRRVDKVYTAADHIVAVSDTYAQRAMMVNKKCSKPTIVYLGTEASVFEENIKENIPPYLKSDDQFWVGYCGTLGHSYDLSTVIKSMKLLSDRGVDNAHLVVIGSGPLENKFKEEAADLGIQCIFTGKLPYEQMCAQLAQCDIAVNPIAAGAAQSIINKHADYAIAGLPVVNTQENEEYRMLLSDYACGMNCEAGNAVQVADAISELALNEEVRRTMRVNSRRLGLDKFDRSKTYGEIVNFVQAIADTKI